MTENLERYFNIMERYSKGEFGTDNLTMLDILEKAEESDLMMHMSMDEINYLANKSFGMIKMLFKYEINKRYNNLDKKNNSLVRNRKLY